MPENEDTRAKDKELTIDDLESVAGGLEEDTAPAAGIRVAETAGGNKGVEID